MKRYYLAHSLELRKPIRKWQLKIEKLYRVKLINPFYRNKWEINMVKKAEDNPEIKYEWTLEDCERIVVEDLNLIRKSDGIVAIFDNPTIGTCQEIIMGAYHYRIPVYVITEKHHHHPWIRALAHWSDGKVFKSMREFRLWLNSRELKRVKK